MDYGIVLLKVLMGLAYAGIGYFVLLLIMTIIFARYPRKPFDDYPDWGLVKEYRVLTNRDKKLETWVVYPDSIKDKVNGDELFTDNPAVVITHGWGRNRGRMVTRARHWQKLGYTTILYSTRDHGNSDKEPMGMSIIRFSQDIDSIVNWWGVPVIIQGHSIGAGATIIAGSRNKLVRGIVVDSSMRAIPTDIGMIYKPVFKKWTPVLALGLKVSLYIFFMILLRYERKEFSPHIAGRDIKVPTLLVYAKHDTIFPPSCGEALVKIIEGSKLVVLENANHSTIPEQSEYGGIIKDFLEDHNLL
jgi:pimeloyl-ACP methyl ester carboxylesterase